MVGYQPDHWLGVIGLAIIAVAVIGAAAIPAWLTARGTKQVRGDVSKVQDQVANGHTTNLRDEFDGMRSDILRVLHSLTTVDDRLDFHGRELRGMREDISQIHDEIRGDRAALRDFESRVTAAYKRDNPDTEPM